MLTHGDDNNADRRILCRQNWIFCNSVEYNKESPAVCSRGAPETDLNSGRLHIRRSFLP